jgi:hypothetical protein
LADSTRAELDPWEAVERRQLEDAVAAAESELVDLEVAVETLRVELAHFAHVHHQRLGDLYLRLDELDAEVAEAVALRTGDPEDLRRAREARDRLEESLREAETEAEEARTDAAGTAGSDGDAGGEATGSRRGRRDRIRPGREAQRLYRELARRAHPDLAQDPTEKRRREEFMRRVNDAYGLGDVDMLTRLGAEWAAGPDSAPARGSADRLDWLRTRLDWLRTRIAELRAERAELEASPIGQLLGLDPTDPDGLLDRLADQLREQVVKYEDLLQRASEIS